MYLFILVILQFLLQLIVPHSPPHMSISSNFSVYLVSFSIFSMLTFAQFYTSFYIYFLLFSLLLTFLTSDLSKFLLLFRAPRFFSNSESNE